MPGVSRQVVLTIYMVFFVSPKHYAVVFLLASLAYVVVSLGRCCSYPRSRCSAQVRIPRMVMVPIPYYTIFNVVQEPVDRFEAGGTAYRQSVSNRVACWGYTDRDLHLLSYMSNLRELYLEGPESWPHHDSGPLFSSGRAASPPLCTRDVLG